MSFAAEVRRWATPEDLSAYLAGRMAPPWAVGVTLHHTVKPIPAQWNGLGSMQNLIKYYRDTQKWPAGPNLFICVGSKHPDDDGIWRLKKHIPSGKHRYKFVIDGAWSLDLYNPLSASDDTGGVCSLIEIK